MRRHYGFTRLLFSSFCYLLLLKEHDWIIRVTLKSGTYYFVFSYVVTNNVKKVFPNRSINQKSQISAPEIFFRKLNEHHQRTATTATLTQLNMCICINCARVINCSAYYFVETKHEQPHIAAQPTFTPRDGSPTIHVNIRTPDRTSLSKTTTDSQSARSDARNRIWSEEMKFARGREITATTESKTDEIDEIATTTESGETIIPISTTYTEYDVVACADYVEDINCWVRNMPDEIKRANPNFVPT